MIGKIRVSLETTDGLIVKQAFLTDTAEVPNIIKYKDNFYEYLDYRIKSQEELDEYVFLPCDKPYELVD